MPGYLRPETAQGQFLNFGLFFFLIVTIMNLHTT